MKWEELYNIACETVNPVNVSNFIDAGGVAAVILTDKGNIYKGVCIDTACSLGMCAERNAISTMITNNEYKIKKLVCIGKDKNNFMMPCGACREFMMQLQNGNEKLEILTSINPIKTIKLEELTPKWWTNDKVK